MGTTKQMKVKCYNFNRITKMLDIWHNDFSPDLDKFLRLMHSNEVEIFQPPRAPGSCRGRRLPQTYLKANHWLDQYMREQNTWAVLKGKSPVKPGYKECSSQI